MKTLWSEVMHCRSPPFVAYHVKSSACELGCRWSRISLFQRQDLGGRGGDGGLMLGSSYKGIEMESEAMQTRWNYTS